MKPSRQRALIALRSFTSVAAAARSVGTNANTLLRMTVGDQELGRAYRECRDGVLRARQREEAAASGREKKVAESRITERAAERNQRRLFRLRGQDPAVAVAALHKRLNRERRQEKAADLKEALDRLDELQAEARTVKPVTKRTLDVWDRWCANCKEHRVDDPCEVCSRHTVLVKGDGGPTTREAR